MAPVRLRLPRRPNRGWFKKAGNLRYGFELADGDYILLLDADFAPRADLLDETMPYLDPTRTSGIVQSPQFFRVHRRADLGRARRRRGAGAVLPLGADVPAAQRRRRSASAAAPSTGGRRWTTTAASTLIEHSEDVHTGFDLRRLGWDLRYLPVALAAGICPDDVAAFLNQQYRWCSGLDEPARLDGSSGRPSCGCAPGCATSPASSTTCTPALFTFVAPLVP